MIPFTWRHGFEEGFREGQEEAGTQTLHYSNAFGSSSIEQAAEKAAWAASKAAAPSDPDSSEPPSDGPELSPTPAEYERMLEQARNDYKLLDEQLTRMAAKHSEVSKAYISIMESLGLRYAGLNEKGFAETEKALNNELTGSANADRLAKAIEERGGAIEMVGEPPVVESVTWALSPSARKLMERARGRTVEGK